MNAFYPFILTLHLFCAIFFVGYLFVDVCILGLLKRKNENLDRELFDTLGVRIMPFIVLLLFLSGGMLASAHFNPLNLLFLAKIILASLIFVLVIFSLLCYFVFKIENPLKNAIHPLVFGICIGVVILAKMMNYFYF